MKKPILTIFAFFVLIQSALAQIFCSVDGPSIVCQGERVTIFYDTDTTYTQVFIDAFTVINGTQVLALQENKTDNSADIIFLAGGDAEIVVRFLDGNNTTSACNLNVFVLDETPIPALGMLSNFLEDQVTCESIDLEFEMFVVCPDCPFYWSLNDEIIDLEQEVTFVGALQVINARLQVDGVGSYSFCHHILKQDSSCFVKDCISIDIVEVEVQPVFSLDEDESIFCMGTSLYFTNETIVEEDVFYIWEITYDSLQWNNSGEDLEFDFLFPGEYLVSLQYYVVGDENCISDKTTMNITIADSPIIPISCSSNSCLDSIFTYQALIDCETYEWIIDESLGEIVSNDESGITVRWNEVDQYTETKVKLSLESCDEDVCIETFREVILFPSTIGIEGVRGVCDKGMEWYTADLIPGALYTWEIEIIDSISGIAPQINKLDENRVRIAFNSFIGQLSIRVHATIESRQCEVSNEIAVTSLFISTNNNLCPGDLFKASVLPKIDQEVVWTLTNESTGYINQQTLSGQNSFFAIDLNNAGSYLLNVEVPTLEFECGEDIAITVLDNPAVILNGPEFICPGDSVNYTLAGLGANDIVEWTIFQSNSATELVGNEITILWEEGGAPYIIKVSRSTEVMAGQICDSESFVFNIQDSENLNFEIVGPEVLCYDAIDTFQVVDNPGTYIWEIDPPYMGTIVEGDSTEKVIIQWHYNPDIPFATLSTQRVICDSIYNAAIDIYFEPFVPGLMAPDSVCQGDFKTIELLDLESFTTVDFYINGVLERENAIKHTHFFADTGYYDILIEIVNPNGCPGVAVVTKQIYSSPAVQFNLLTSDRIKQCPKESFQDVIVTVDFQDSESYYTWVLDSEIVQEGFGEEALYTFVITNEMINAGVMGLTVAIDPPDLCPNSVILPLSYVCEKDICVCIDPIDAQVDYLTLLECNLANFGGSIDFSTVINPYWSIALVDTFIIIPINGPEDLVQDSFYFDGDVPFAQVALRGSCPGVIASLTCEGDTIYSEIVDSTLCEVFIDEITETMYYPDFVREYICNEDLTYDIIFTERRLRNTSPPYTSTVTWVINGVTYEGISIIMEDVPGGTPLTIEMTQCSLDGTYCCTMQYETTVRNEFSPNIILPNGSCENDLWLFTLDVSQSEIESTLWDFGDGSGSTLLLTEKGFLDTLSHDISVVVTDNLGCVATAEITVASFPNNIEGEIHFQNDPCAPTTDLTYVENSESNIINYDWSFGNAPDSSVVQVSMSDNYSVTVTDNNGCTSVAHATDIKVNESFVGGLRFKPENCGRAIASIFANSDYTYEWYLNGDPANTGSSLTIVSPGSYEIKVVSTSVDTNEKCDSISESIVVLPLPANPIIVEEKIFCDPFITELSVSNYASALWNSSVGLPQEGASILVSQNGTYRASIEDENGCRNSSSRVINEVKIPFDQLLDQCIQACREDLDSLAISIPGIAASFTSWTWVTVDSFGIEYEVQPSSGPVTPLLITSDMFDYIQLEVSKEDCIYRSERIPLDIENCSQPEPPVEIICESIDSGSPSCGQTIYKCLVSAENGGPKLYFEGSVTLPMDAVLCSEDSLSVSLNNGHIVITDLLIEESDGKLTAFYSANIIISDPEDYQENGTILKFDFCNEEGEVAFCYEYNLPYRSCNIDFDCLIDYHGISSGANNTVDINYCLNLSEVVQDDCVLSTYAIRAMLSGDIAVKTIFTKVIEGDFDNLYCINIPVSQEDFYGGAFQCIELMIEGDCLNISCSEYQCGIFGTSNLISNFENATPNELIQDIESTSRAAKEIELDDNFEIYPNPTTGFITFKMGDNQLISKEANYGKGSWIVIKNTIGQTIKSIQVNGSKTLTEDLRDQVSGLYIANFIYDGKLISAQKFLLIR